MTGGGLVVGDLDGDGADDLAVGLPWRGGYYANRGEVRVLHGPLSPGRIDLDATGMLVIPSDPAAVNFGRALAGGALDPDPGIELVVGGAIGDASSYTGGTDRPAVWLYQDL